jgi:colanic acid biosynthesis glycosyl transferase WcaI
VRDRAAARRIFGIPDGTLLAVYAGNLGRKQNLEIIIEAAAMLLTLPPADAARARVRIIIAGDGAARANLEQSLRSHPGAAVQLLPLLSDDGYTSLLRAADVAMITQAAGTGRFFFTSKLLSVLAAGLPVVAVADADSELAAAVHAGGFGRVVPPGDAVELAAVLRSLCESTTQLESWARRTSWVGQFSREAILPRFEQMLLAAARCPEINPVEKPMATLQT